MKTKICSVGECMIEIANTKNNIFQQSFAGDTLNFCNYIDKKYFDVSFLTAIGKTSVNRSVLEFINSKKISTKLIKQVNSCLLYTSPSPRDLSTSRMPSSA